MKKIAVIGILMLVISFIGALSATTTTPEETYGNQLTFDVNPLNGVILEKQINVENQGNTSVQIYYDVTADPKDDITITYAISSPCIINAGENITIPLQIQTEYPHEITFHVASTDPVNISFGETGVILVTEIQLIVN